MNNEMFSAIGWWRRHHAQIATQIRHSKPKNARARSVVGLSRFYLESNHG